MDTESKVLRIILGLLLAISLGIFIWFFLTASGIDPKMDVDTKVDLFGPVLESFIMWAYILAFIAAAGTLFAAVIDFVSNPKDAVKTLIPIGLLVLVCGISWSLASSELLHMPTYDGTGNEPGTLKWAGASLYAMYILSVIAVGAIIISEVSKIFK